MSDQTNQTVRNLFVTAKAIQAEVDTELGPPESGAPSSSQLVLPFSIVRGTRGYLERVVNQVNGCFERGWYDGCAVMVRRLLETLIIETFEHHKIAQKIKGPSGDFFYLADLISACLSEQSWNLSRNTKSGLPRLKDIGDKSAHSRRFNAQKGDVSPLLGDIRVVVQELIYLSALK